MNTNLKVFGVVILTLGVYTWVANAIPQLESVVPEELTFGSDVTEEQLVTAGDELFHGAAGCTTCHGLGTRAPNLLSDHNGQGTIGQRCGTRKEGYDCKAYIYESITSPSAYVVEGFDPMVFMSSIFSPSQIYSLVAFLESQGGTVDVSGQDIQTAEAEQGTATAAAGGGGAAGGGPTSTATEPREIMRANLCFGCHKLDDEGAEIGPPFNGMGSRIDADRIRRSILDPGAEAADGYEQLLGTMPPNFGDLLTAGQLEALVQFLSQQSN